MIPRHHRRRSPSRQNWLNTATVVPASPATSSSLAGTSCFGCASPPSARIFRERRVCHKCDNFCVGDSAPTTGLSTVPELELVTSLSKHFWVLLKLTCFYVLTCACTIVEFRLGNCGIEMPSHQKLSFRTRFLMEEVKSVRR